MKVNSANSEHVSGCFLPKTQPHICAKFPFQKSCQVLKKKSSLVILSENKIF